MRVLFATPPWAFEEIYPASMSRTGGLGGDRHGTITGVTEPLGMLYLSAVLLREGMRPAILDGYGLEPAVWLRRIEEARPDVLGLTLSSFSWTKALPLLPRVKERLPDTRVVLGGPHPTAVGARALREMPCADFAVRGAGEYALARLCRTLRAAEPVGDIPGLAFRGEKDVTESAPEPLPDLDALPFPARRLVDMSRYRPSVGFYNQLPSASMVTSRGCPRRCRFCVSGKPFLVRSPEGVMEEIRESRRDLGTRHVVFWDEDIAARKGHAEALCEALLREDAGLSWCASLAMDRVEPERVRLMKRAGCWKLLFGIESGVPRHLETLGKRIRLDEVADRLKLVRREGIETYATFMFGIPGETRQDVLRTIRFAARQPLDYALFLNFTPFPGTSYYDEMDKHGTFQGVWSTQAVSFVPHTLTLDELKELRVLAYRRFYLRPRYVLRRLLHTRSRHDWSRNLRGLIAALRLRVSGIH